MSYRPARSATARSVIGGRVRWGSLSRRGRGPLPAGSGGRVKAIMGLESARNGDAHASRFGRLAAVPASVWPCKPSSRLNRAPLFCALVIRSTLFAKLSAIRLFRSTHVFKSGGTSGGRRRTRLALTPPQPLGVATKAASAPSRRNAIASVQHRANGPSASGCNVALYLSPPVFR